MGPRGVPRSPPLPSSSVVTQVVAVIRVRSAACACWGSLLPPPKAELLLDLCSNLLASSTSSSGAVTLASFSYSAPVGAQCQPSRMIDGCCSIFADVHLKAFLLLPPLLCDSLYHLFELDASAPRPVALRLPFPRCNRSQVWSVPNETSGAIELRLGSMRASNGALWWPPDGCARCGSAAPPRAAPASCGSRQRARCPGRR
jgi:hypothetical protein